VDSLGNHILRYVSTEPAGTLVLAKELLHLAGREAIDQALGGDAVRALAWLGPACSAEAVQVLRKSLPRSDLEEALQTRGRLPTWIAHVLGKVASGTGNVRL